MSKWSLSAVADTMPLCTMPLSTTPLSTTPPTMGSITPPTMGSLTMEPTLDTPHTREYSLPHTLLARGRPRLRPAQRLKLMLQDQNVMLKDMVMHHPDTAKRLLKKLPTMYLYLPQLISLSRFPTLFPKRFVLTNPFLFPVVSCADIVVTKCIQVPTVQDSSVTVAACKAQLGAPACTNHELSLPKQRCIALVYGHAEHVAPGYHHKAL